MSDRENVIKALREDVEWCMALGGVPDHVKVPAKLYAEVLKLLQDMNAYYAGMTIEWLHEIIMNNFEDEHQIRYVDALEDVRDRAIHGLKNYYADMQT